MILLLGCIAAAQGQEVYEESWTISGLHHPLARTIIAQANDWLTRDNNTAATARLDDPLRVTVVVYYDPTTRLRSAKLVRLVMGTIVIDNGFSDFLSTGTLDSLVRRNYFWHDATLTVINQELWPYAVRNYEPSLDNMDDYTAAFAAADRIPERRLDLFESSATVSPDVRLWAGLGFEELALPGFSYGKARVGIGYRQLKFWGELPSSILPSNTMLLDRRLDGTFGVGISFESDLLGGALTLSDPSEWFGTKAAESDTGYTIGRSALFYFIIPIGRSPVGEGYVRLKLGPGYIQTVRRVEHDKSPGAFGYSDDRFKLMGRLEYASAKLDGSLERSAAAELFTEFTRTSLLFSWNEQFSRTWGLHTSLALHGITGNRDPYLPPVSIMISPTFTF